MKELGQAKTIGELKELIKSYPDETSFGFRNQPMQTLYEVIHDKDVFVVFQEGYNEEVVVTRFFVVSYAFSVNGALGNGQINITSKGNGCAYMKRSKILKIISESCKVGVDSIVITNIVELTEQEYNLWIQ